MANYCQLKPVNINSKQEATKCYRCKFGLQYNIILWNMFSRPLQKNSLQYNQIIHSEIWGDTTFNTQQVIKVVDLVNGTNL